jgi:hypothetical protein
VYPALRAAAQLEKRRALPADDERRFFLVASATGLRVSTIAGRGLISAVTSRRARVSMAFPFSYSVVVPARLNPAVSASLVEQNQFSGLVRA